MIRAFTVVLVFLVSLGVQSQNQGVELLYQMVDRIENLNSFSGEMIGQERVDGELRPSHSKMIIQFKPRCLYAQAITDEGEIGNEILYREGLNENKVLVSPDGFPYVNINLDPQSSFMRNNRHNTVLEAGGTYLATIIRTMLETSDSLTLAQSVRYEGEQEYEGKKCFKVVIENPHYGYVDYQAKAGETVRSIAFSQNVAEYRIVELNEAINDFDDSPAEETIKIPNSYAEKTVLLLDVNHLMPWFMSNYDDQGLFSSYKYKWITVNPTITKDTFDPENPTYGF